MPNIETLARHMQSADTLVACFVAFNLAFVAMLYIAYQIRGNK